jgi:hypothetical protein
MSQEDAATITFTKVDAIPPHERRGGGSTGPRSSKWDDFLKAVLAEPTEKFKLQAADAKQATAQAAALRNRAKQLEIEVQVAQRGREVYVTAQVESEDAGDGTGEATN